MVHLHGGVYRIKEEVSDGADSAFVEGYGYVEIGTKCESMLSIAQQIWLIGGKCKSEAESFFDITLTASERRILSSFFDLFEREENGIDYVD